MKYLGDLGRINDIDDLFEDYTTNINIPFEGDEINVDLSRVSFISPLGAISLLLLLDILDSSYYVNVVPPRKNVVSYMERMNFFEHCTGEVYECFENYYDLEAFSNRNRHNTSNVLLEITSIKEDEDVEEVDISIRKILTSHGMSSKDANIIAYIMSEFVANILDHSQGIGFTAIQYYPSINKVHLAVGDNGIGIVKSLKPTLSKENGKMTNLQVIKSAFESGISSSPNIKRGIGLNHARSLSFENVGNTSFYMRTHKAIYKITDNDITISDRSDYFPGTYISLEITF